MSWEMDGSCAFSKLRVVPTVFFSGQHWGLRKSNGKRKVSEFLSLLESVCLQTGKLIWNTKMEVWKIILLLIVFSFRFHVNLPGVYVCLMVKLLVQEPAPLRKSL